MPTGLKGPHGLDAPTIERVVTRTAPGVYALGGADVDAKPSYVGRSDTDVKDRLKSYVGNSKYAKFMFDYFPSPKAAFEKECVLFHDLSPKDNTNHPGRPAGTDWKCPRCKVFA